MLKEEKTRAIVFDCDGTLVDTEPSHVLAWKEVAMEYGVELTAEECHTMVGQPDSMIAPFVAQKVGHSSPHELFQKKTDHFMTFLRQGFAPIEETVHFLRRLLKEKESLGLKVGLASAASREELFVYLTSLGLESAFDVVLSGHDDLGEYEDPDGVNKPQPYVYLHAAKLLGVKPSECIVFEDSYTGIKAASRAGCLVIALVSATSQRQDLSEAHSTLESLEHYSPQDVLEIASQVQRSLSGNSFD